MEMRWVSFFLVMTLLVGSWAWDPEHVRDVASAIDKSVDPCNDFYKFSCGSWIKNTTIPADKPRYGRGFTVLAEKNDQIIRHVAEADSGLLGKFFASCMDEATVNKRGSTPLYPWFDYIDRAVSEEGLDKIMEIIAKLHMVDVRVFWQPEATADLKSPEKTILVVTFGGLGMPDRDYYFKHDEKHAKIKSSYRKHIVSMLKFARYSDSQATQLMEKIYTLEEGLAKATLTRSERRQEEKLYNKTGLVGLERVAPGLPWTTYLTNMHIFAHSEISVQTAPYFSAVARTITTMDREVLKAYLKYHVVDSLGGTLCDEVVNERFEFMGKVIHGQKELGPRWKRCIKFAEETLGDEVGRAFVEKMFPEESKDVAKSMIKEVERSFENRINQLEWMDPQTKDLAKEKLHRVQNKIGYPDLWWSYPGVEMDPSDFIGNVLTLRVHNSRRHISLVGRPTDRNRWYMTAAQVNAYYEPSMNEIAFPAGILQPPFFHKDFPPSMNYGAIGVVMGHEITHGFDDQGAKYDATGRLHNWWGEKSYAEYTHRTQCVADQFSKYEALPGTFVNGNLTLGENIADLGGVLNAYGAFKAHVKRWGAEERFLPEYSSDQLFFIAFAQCWCQLQTPESEAVQIATDPHSPAVFRVIGTLANSDEFREAFNCPAKPGRDKCSVW